MTVCCMDIYCGHCITVGGNSVNFATQGIKSGAEHVSVVGGVGTDDYGIIIKEHLNKYNIDSSHIYTIEGKTASNKIYITESGERFFAPDSWFGGVYETFKLSENDWDFVCGHDIVAIPSNNPNFFTTLEKVKKSKIVVDFLDTRNFNLLDDVMPKISIGFISGDKEVIDRLKPLSLSVDTPIVVTLGSEGSITLKNGIEYFSAAVNVKNIIDTTGCGDSYQGAYTVSWFRNNDVRIAMEHGSIAASHVLTHYGGVE
jgi:fructoselysine 6-kinase